ncbi:serine/threonine protein kinase [Chryseobacterium sp. 22543]|uniref:serine/threonine protein kinase n=1 Tax=Chryseobacterium sp. 22543 TaxID=3453940 RepID=UPI003F852930
MDLKETVVYYTYNTMLEREGIAYIEDENWLYHHQRPNYKNNWTIYVSALINHSTEILKRVIPVVKKYNIPFRLVKNDECGFLLNTGVIGFDEVGKFLSICTESWDQANAIVKELSPLLQDYLGPAVPGALRIEKNIYGHLVTEVVTNTVSGPQVRYTIEVPKRNKIPFSIDARFKDRSKRKIYGKYYLKIKDLRPGPKGDILLAYSLRKMKFKPVVIKEGRHGVLEDTYKRTIEDRLIWQVLVLQEIGAFIPTAKVLDFFVSDHNSYLVIEYLDGVFLPDKVDQIKNGAQWLDLKDIYKVRLLRYYKNIVGVIGRIHQLGYVHRDIQDNNFVITKDDEVFVIDFELAYNSKKGEPVHPFLLGTFGYISPEQIRNERPVPEMDIYSLGALLCFILTGEHPSTFITEDLKETKSKLKQQVDHEILIEIVLWCLSDIPSKRPSIAELEAEINKYIKYLETKNN